MIEHGHKTRHADPNDTLEQGNDVENGVRGGSAQVALRFRQYHVEPSARVLLRDGHPIALGSRAFDLLLTLLESRGGTCSQGGTYPKSLASHSC
jgi:DNA-binding response OmpR family regulator